MFTAKNILVPTDFTEFSDRAIQAGVEIALQNHGKLHLLHVVDKVQQCTVDYCIAQADVEKIQSDIDEEAIRKMHEETGKIPDADKLEVIYDVKTGTPYEEILKEQRDFDSDLIIIAPHDGEGFLKRITGIVEHVTRDAKCPVLLVH